MYDPRDKSGIKDRYEIYSKLHDASEFYPLDTDMPIFEDENKFSSNMFIKRSSIGDGSFNIIVHVAEYINNTFVLSRFQIIFMPDDGYIYGYPYVMATSTNKEAVSDYIKEKLRDIEDLGYIMIRANSDYFAKVPELMEECKSVCVLWDKIREMQ